MSKCEALDAILAVERNVARTTKFRKGDWGRVRRALIALGFDESERQQFAAKYEYATGLIGSRLWTGFTEQRW